MTRRDYCAVCDDMVHDYDVFCYYCNESMCSDCATTYDPMTRICILNSMFNVYLRKIMRKKFSQKQFKQLVEDIQSDEVKNYIQDICFDEKKNSSDNINYFNETYDGFMKKSSVLIDTYNNNTDIIKDTQQNIPNNTIYSIVENFFYNYSELNEIIPFKCYTCHKENLI